MRIAGIVVTCILLNSACVLGQSPDTDCSGMLGAALKKRFQPPSGGEAMYREVQVTTVAIGPKGRDTVTEELVAIESGSLQVMISDSGNVEVWQDTSALVMVNHRAKTLNVVDLSSASQQEVIKTQHRLQELFADSLVEHSTGVSCRTLREINAKDPPVCGGCTRISFTVIETMRPLYGAQRIVVDVRDDGEIVRFRLQHPNGHRFESTEYVVRDLNRQYTEIETDLSVADRFLPDGRKLAPQYDEYTLTGVR